MSIQNIDLEKRMNQRMVDENKRLKESEKELFEQVQTMQGYLDEYKSEKKKLLK